MLTPQQEIAIQWLSQPKFGGKTKKEIAEHCEVSDRTLRKWQKLPAFQSELKAEMVRRTQDRLPELLNSMADVAIRDGNASMARLILEANGLLTKQVQIEAKPAQDKVDYDKLDAEIEAFGKRFDEDIH